MVLHLLEYESIKPEEVTTPYDIGIVLGPFLEVGENFPILSESNRFTQAIQLYKQNKFNKFLLSGNDNKDVAKQHLIDLCVPSEDILIEDISSNTYENALLSKRYLEQQGASSKSLLLITSAYHMGRAKKCFNEVGLNVTPLSVDYETSCRETWSISLSSFIPNYRALKNWERLFTEFVSIVYFKLKGYI